MKRIATISFLLSLTFLVSPAHTCTPNRDYVPPTIEAESARSHSVVVATITEFRLLSDQTNASERIPRRQAKFYVLFSLKGNLKVGDLVPVLDEPNPCDLGFSQQFLDEQMGREGVNTTSNTWVLFLSGKPPFKLWESPRSAPLNLFGTDEMRQLFIRQSNAKK